MAVPRTTPRDGSDGSARSSIDEYLRYRYLYDGYYRYPYWSWYRPSWLTGGLWNPYGAFGLGYFYFDPYWWEYSSVGWSGYDATYEEGKLRLKVQPREAQVFVDGGYVGLVDDFDGIFQRLSLPAGTHTIEIKAEGYEPLLFDVRVLPDETITYRGALTPLVPPRR